MKKKLFTAIGLMSGTSMDGVDVSIIRSNGIDEFVNISDEYFEYNVDLYEKLRDLRKIILNINDLSKYSQKISDIQREITLFHGEIVNSTSTKHDEDIDLVGFHGQTIFHSPDQKITKQLGDGNLLSQLVKKKVVYDFRQEDLLNNGQGAPLTPIFHNLLSNNINKKYQIHQNLCKSTRLVLNPAETTNIYPNKPKPNSIVKLQRNPFKYVSIHLHHLHRTHRSSNHKIARFRQLHNYRSRKIASTRFRRGRRQRR